ncbi:MAG: GHMP kinase [Thermoplasmata archaeon]|nr:GHMP kinase [Thermoplasmata archaeon]
MRARAFCPGHVTGFFEICKGEDFLSSGSRGAGLCTSLGATSEVEMVESRKRRIEVRIDGILRDAEATIGTINRLTANRNLSISVSTALDLPESQGFGMSAAGALSAGLALCEILGLARSNAFEAAHSAEIENRTGMGDVPAIHRGGVTIREIAGLPPRGLVHRIEGNPNVVLAVVGESLKTAGVLDNPEFVSRVNKEGRNRVSELLGQPSIENLMRLSASFAEDTGLASSDVRAAMESASSIGPASMAMLGNSVFAIGPTDELVSALSDHGKTFVAAVDTEGARLLPGR